MEDILGRSHYRLYEHKDYATVQSAQPLVSGTGSLLPVVNVQGNSREQHEAFVDLLLVELNLKSDQALGQSLGRYFH